MIELGKYGTTFVVHSSYWFNKEEQPIKDLSIKFEGRLCKVTGIYDKSICLVLVTNDQNDCIEAGY